MGVMNHTIGLKKDGTCVGVGYNYYGQCNVSSWKDIKQIVCGYNYTVGLKKDGTCVAVGDNNNGQCNVEDWTDIKQVSCGSFYTVGLKSDGTCVAVGDNYYKQCNVSDWTDVVLLMDNLPTIIKYILNSKNKYYSIDDKYYNSEIRKYESISNVFPMDSYFLVSLL